MDNSETKVLLVDDNLAVRKVALLFLTNAGFSVEVADDADNALQVLSSQSFDVLITDMIMPGTMTGLDLILFVQEHYPNTQCGLISGLSDGQDRWNPGRCQGFKNAIKAVFQSRYC